MFIFDFKKYMQTQCEEINKHTWIESEKAGYDLGEIAKQEWIEKYAKRFREWAETQKQYYKEN